MANFDANGASIYSNMPKSCTLPAVYNNDVQDTSCVVTPPEITPNDGYMFIGWSVDKNAKTSDSNYVYLTKELHLYLKRIYLCYKLILQVLHCDF